MQIIRSSLEKIINRGADPDGKGGYVCKICGSMIQMKATGRSIWYEPFEGGFGEVRMVGVVWCPGCDIEPTLPSYGTPIYNTELCNG